MSSGVDDNDSRDADLPDRDLAACHDARLRTRPTTPSTSTTITTSSSSLRRTAGAGVARSGRTSESSLSIASPSPCSASSFVALGFVSGPIPGPGGIPLILLGLAVWSSEFEWAHQLMQWFKAELHRYRTWSRAKKTLFWVAFFGCCGVLGYLYLLTLGPPAWLPGSVDMLLQRLPGL